MLSQHMLQGYEAKYPDMDADAVDDAFRLLRRGSQLMRELKAFYALHGMSSTQFMTMIVVDCQPERSGVVPSELAVDLDVTRPVASITIDALVRRGLLTSICSKDSRFKRVSLSPRGRVELANKLPDYFALIANFMTSKSPDYL
ncbi:MarR family transcriptional regulator [Sphingomonas sp. GM_Shp_1]|uniref:MarR family winged helix-turn-helix transcriptional regulator n=1 Tax=Sphingomonas sp. GM_Shp_1 TaxID=2937381 RepID=UPI00226AFE84|nr:MarR family transcriptional regulator [Sphingomonas sp. GM_Shp_1]